jgi:hypothetical protein
MSAVLCALRKSSGGGEALAYGPQWALPVNTDRGVRRTTGKTTHINNIYMYIQVCIMQSIDTNDEFS